MAVAKEQNFQHPTRGHVAMLYYDIANKRFQVVQGDDVDTAIPATAKAMLSSALAHGYDGTLWRKLSLIWGYSDRWAEALETTVTVAGTNYVQSAAVSAGYVHVVGAVTSQNNTTQGNREHHLVGGGVTVQLIRSLAVAAGVWQIQFPVGQVLKVDDYVQGQYESCAINDKIRLRVWGYKMKIDM